MQTNHWYAAVPCILALTLASASSQEPVATSDAGKALFLQHCAACHGVLGDGEGVVKHERKARSFKDGGFSFGNTPEALFRTISTGIPGTPMPGFDSALNEAERRTVAAYVRELGPDDLPLEPKGSEMVVKDRSVIVRGALPPITEGVSEQVRGLLIGTPEGLTFEYRIDDVRLLGIRQGRFVNRSDWGGRGGTALEPLGKVVHLMESGNPRPTWDTFPYESRARMRGTWIRDGQAGLSYDLESDKGVIAHIDEWVRPESTSVGSGFTRCFKVKDESSGSLALFLCRAENLDPDIWSSPFIGETQWWAWPAKDGLTRRVGFTHRGQQPPKITDSVRSIRMTWREDGELNTFRAAIRGPRLFEFEVTYLTTSGTDEEVRKALATEVGR